MQMIPIKAISFDDSNFQVNIKNERYDLKDLIFNYSESKLFSYLEIRVKDKCFQTRALKSIWEHLNLSTYDVIEKREDNKVYNLYCYLIDLKNNLTKKACNPP
jgi:hypothetical protein